MAKKISRIKFRYKGLKEYIMKKNFYTVYKNLALPLKASLWFTICNFILKAISFITVPLFTRYLSTEE